MGRLGEAYGEALSAQRAIIRAATTSWDGREMGTEGDSFFVVFSSARPGAALQGSGEQACPCGELDRDGAAIGRCRCAASEGRTLTIRHRQNLASSAVGPCAQPDTDYPVRRGGGRPSSRPDCRPYRRFGARLSRAPDVAGCVAIPSYSPADSESAGFLCIAAYVENSLICRRPGDALISASPTPSTPLRLFMHGVRTVRCRGGLADQPVACRRGG